MATRSDIVGPELDIVRLARTLNEHGVDYVVVGGIAAMLHGASRGTRDADLLIDSSTENVERFLAVCKLLRVRQRTTNPDLDRELAHRSSARQWLVSDVQDIFLTLQTDAGPVDLLPSIASTDGRKGFNDISPVVAQIGDGADAVSVKVLSLERLIESKTAVGRPSDLEALPELRELQRQARLATNTSVVDDFDFGL